MHALQVAVAAVRTGSGTGRSAIWKLGGALDDEQPPVSARVPDRPELPVIRAAVASRSAIEFVYRGTRRGTSIRGACSCGEASGTSPGSTTTAGSSGRSGSTASTVAPPRSASGRRDVRTPCRLRSAVGVPRDPKQIGQSTPTRRSKPRARSMPAGPRRRCANSARSGWCAATTTVRSTSRAGANVDAFRSWVLGLLEHAVVARPAGRCGHRSSTG